MLIGVIWMLYGCDAREIELKMWAHSESRSRSSSALLVNREDHIVYKGGYQHGNPGPERDAEAIRLLLISLRKEVDAPGDGVRFPNRYTRHW